jgi:hypothetical protein
MKVTAQEIEDNLFEVVYEGLMMVAEITTKWESDEVITLDGWITVQYRVVDEILSLTQHDDIDIVIDISDPAKDEIRQAINDVLE